MKESFFSIKLPQDTLEGTGWCKDVYSTDSQRHSASGTWGGEEQPPGEVYLLHNRKRCSSQKQIILYCTSNPYFQDWPWGRKKRKFKCRSNPGSNSTGERVREEEENSGRCRHESWKLGNLVSSNDLIPWKELSLKVSLPPLKDCCTSSWFLETPFFP